MSNVKINIEYPTCCNECPLYDDSGDYPTCFVTKSSRGYNFDIYKKKMHDCPLSLIKNGKKRIS